MDIDLKEYRKNLPKVEQLRAHTKVWKDIFDKYDVNEEEDDGLLLDEMVTSCDEGDNENENFLDLGEFAEEEEMEEIEEIENAGCLAIQPFTQQGRSKKLHSFYSDELLNEMKKIFDEYRENLGKENLPFWKSESFHMENSSHEEIFQTPKFTHALRKNRQVVSSNKAMGSATPMQNVQLTGYNGQPSWQDHTQSIFQMLPMQNLTMQGNQTIRVREIQYEFTVNNDNASQVMNLQNNGNLDLARPFRALAAIKHEEDSDTITVDLTCDSPSTLDDSISRQSLSETDREREENLTQAARTPEEAKKIARNPNRTLDRRTEKPLEPFSSSPDKAKKTARNPIATLGFFEFGRKMEKDRKQVAASISDKAKKSARLPSSSSSTEPYEQAKRMPTTPKGIKRGSSSLRNKMKPETSPHREPFEMNDNDDSKSDDDFYLHAKEIPVGLNETREKKPNVSIVANISMASSDDGQSPYRRSKTELDHSNVSTASSSDDSFWMSPDKRLARKQARKQVKLNDVLAKLAIKKTSKM